MSCSANDLVFLVRVTIAGKDYLGVFDTGATISIVPRQILARLSMGTSRPTVAIRMGDGRVAHSVGDCVLEVPMGWKTISHPFYVMDTEAFDFVLGTDFLTQHPEILSLTLQSPYVLWVDHGGGREAVPLEHADTSSRHLRVMKEEGEASNLSQERAAHVGERELESQAPQEVMAAVPQMDPGLHRPSPHAFRRAERAELRRSGSLKPAWNAAEPDGGESLPVTITGEEPSSQLLAASKLVDYQLDKKVLVEALREMGFTLEDVNVELFATRRQHVLDLYCSPGVNSAYKFYWAALGLCYGNPRFSDLGKVLTKAAWERARLLLCTPDCGASGGNKYWKTLLDHMRITTVQLPDAEIYVPPGGKKPMKRPGWSSSMTLIDGDLSPVPWEDLDPQLLQEIQDESKGYTLRVLRDRLHPHPQVYTTSGGLPYDVPKPSTEEEATSQRGTEVLSDCGLSELPSSIHSEAGDDRLHDAFYVQTAMEEV